MILPLFTACSKDGKKVNIVAKGTSAYTIILPEDKEEGNAAIKLLKAIEEKTGVTLPYVKDIFSATDQPKSAKEILVGNTDREASKAVAGTVLAADEYVLMKSGSKIVMQGNTYMVAGAAGALVNLYFKSEGTNTDIKSHKSTHRADHHRRPRNGGT